MRWAVWDLDVRFAPLLRVPQPRWVPAPPTMQGAVGRAGAGNRGVITGAGAIVAQPSPSARAVGGPLDYGVDSLEQRLRQVDRTGVLLPRVTRDTTATPQQVWDVLSDDWLFSGWMVGASRNRAVDEGWPRPLARIQHS